MNILEIGQELGKEQGNAETLVRNVEALMKNLSIDLSEACENLGIAKEEYEKAKERILHRM